MLLLLTRVQFLLHAIQKSALYSLSWQYHSCTLCIYNYWAGMRKEFPILLLNHPGVKDTSERQVHLIAYHPATDAATSRRVQSPASSTQYAASAPFISRNVNSACLSLRQGVVIPLMRECGRNLSPSPSTRNAATLLGTWMQQDYEIISGICASLIIKE